MKDLLLLPLVGLLVVLIFPGIPIGLTAGAILLFGTQPTGYVVIALGGIVLLLGVLTLIGAAVMY